MGSETTFHTMPAHFENAEKYGGCKILAGVHTMPERFENGGKFDSNKLIASSGTTEQLGALSNLVMQGPSDAVDR